MLRICAYTICFEPAQTGDLDKSGQYLSFFIKMAGLLANGFPECGGLE
jgi:hypothetical protein